MGRHDLGSATPERRQDRGSATVLAVGVLAGLVTVLITALLLVAVLVAGQQARSAADLAALAAMGQVVIGDSDQQACAGAARVAARNGAALTACALREAGPSPWPEVAVTVTRGVPGTPWSASASAVAGGVSSQDRR